MPEKIGVVGLGYVGLPVALAFAKTFTDTVGFDIKPERVNALLEWQDETGEVSSEELRSADMRFTTDPSELADCTFLVMTVPTPIDGNRQPDLSPLAQACESVGPVLREGALVVFESTVYPGVTEEFCGPILARESGLRQGLDFQLGYSPERINPGDRAHAIDRIVKVVAGEDEAALERTAAAYGAIIDAGVHRAPSIKTAEAAKVIENTQRDLNIALMNELAMIFDRMGIRTQDVLAAAGTKWNFLPFSPGLVGGHCIGVDPYYLTAKAKALGYHPHVILAGRNINDGMGAFIAQRMIKLLVQGAGPVKRSRVGILGLTFKENVPDLRNSRVPDIAAELREFGIEPLIHDPLASPDQAREEYGLPLSPLEAMDDLDGLILAVPHESYLAHAPRPLLDGLKPGGAVVDVKSALDPTQLPEGVSYWSL